MDSNECTQQSLSDIAKIPRWDMSQARQVVKALDESGLSVRKFSQANALGYWRVNNAKRRLNSLKKHSKTGRAKPTLVPVNITTDFPVPIHCSDRWVLEVQLGSCMVRVSQSASEHVLTTTLRAVRGLQC